VACERLSETSDLVLWHEHEVGEAEMLAHALSDRFEGVEAGHVLCGTDADACYASLGDSYTRETWPVARS
jgi:hypothetical protein